MAYVYKIYNDVNDKLYIGQTSEFIEQRFKKHCRDAFEKRYEKRPLYAAMRKYGTKHFFIELIEETNEPNEREVYWINYYNTYKYGYNATFGGEGKTVIDYDEVLDLWNQGLSCKEISKKLQRNIDQICKILELKGISHQEKTQRSYNKRKKAVYQLDKETEEIINIFDSAVDAQKILFIHANNIREVCRGVRKTAGGYKWKYV